MDKMDIRIMEEHFKSGRLFDLAMKLRAFGASSSEMVEAVKDIKKGKPLIDILAEMGLTSKMEIC